MQLDYYLHVDYDGSQPEASSMSWVVMNIPHKGPMESTKTLGEMQALDAGSGCRLLTKYCLTIVAQCTLNRAS